MEAAEFALHFPKLYHLAFASNLNSISTIGLLSASGLADHYSFTPEERLACVEKRRLCNQNLHGIILRDQQPAPESKMKSCLVKITIPEWLGLLNSKVFFFVELKKALRLAETYGAYDNILLEVDTARLLEKYAANASLCRFNAGAFLFKPVPRGRHSFIPMANFEYRNKRNTPSELTIDASIPDIMEISTLIPLRTAPSESLP